MLKVKKDDADTQGQDAIFSYTYSKYKFSAIYITRSRVQNLSCIENAVSSVAEWLER